MTQGSPSPGELAHHGVKGMKWGVRRAEKSVPNARYSEKNRAKDKQLHGARGVKRINSRLNDGQTLKKARSREVRRNAIQAGAVVGAVYTAKAIAIVGPVLAQSVASRAETKRGQAHVSATMGLPRQASSGPSYSKPKQGVYNISSL